MLFWCVWFWGFVSVPERKHVERSLAAVLVLRKEKTARFGCTCRVLRLSLTITIMGNLCHRLLKRTLNLVDSCTVSSKQGVGCREKSQRMPVRRKARLLLGVITNRRGWGGWISSLPAGRYLAIIGGRYILYFPVIPASIWLPSLCLPPIPVCLTSYSICPTSYSTCLTSYLQPPLLCCNT